MLSQVRQDIQDFFYTKDWYRHARSEIVKLYGDNADRFILILAATSPRQGVRANWTRAKRAFSAWKLHGKNADYSNFMLSHRKNLDRIKAAEDLHPDIISGQKVRAFAANLMGNLDRVTVDMWMMQYFGYETVNARVYEHIENKVRGLAHQHGFLAAELQAVLWSAIRCRAGYKPATFLIASAGDHQLNFDFMEC